MKFLADEDLRDSIIRGVLRRLPSIDLLRAQDVGLRTRRDEILLEFAATQPRIAKNGTTALNICRCDIRRIVQMTNTGQVV